MTTRSELFTAYGDDADLALGAWPNLDPTGYAAWSATVERRQYLADYRRWVGRQTVAVKREVAKADDGQVPLFDAPTAGVPTLAVRSTIVHDGHTLDLFALSGPDGARLLREAMLRDLGPASTTVDRCRYGIALADHIEAQSVALGRNVTVGEVLSIGRAA